MKAGDKVGWKAEWVIEEGDEVIKSLEILYNKIEQEKIIVTTSHNKIN